MFPVSKEISSGVAPVAPGLSIGSPFLPGQAGDPSSRRAIVVPMSSTWLISSVLFGADALQQILVRLGGLIPAHVDAPEKELHHRAHLTELSAQAFLQCVGGRRIWLVGKDVVDQHIGVPVPASSCVVTGGRRASGPTSCLMNRTDLRCRTARGIMILFGMELNDDEMVGPAAARTVPPIPANKSSNAGGPECRVTTADISGGARRGDAEHHESRLPRLPDFARPRATMRVRIRGPRAICRWPGRRRPWRFSRRSARHQLNRRFPACG